MAVFIAAKPSGELIIHLKVWCGQSQNALILIGHGGGYTFKKNVLDFIFIFII